MIWIIASVILAMMGPFGSYLSLNFAQRLQFWGTVIGAAVLLAPAVRRMCVAMLGQGRPTAVYDLVATPVFALAYAPPLFLLNEAVTAGTQPLSLIQTIGAVTGVTIALIILRETLHLSGPVPARVEADAPADPRPPLAEADEPEAPFDDPAESPERVPLLERLPEPLRGEIYVISGANHRVEVRTSRGVATVLMRFADALREVDPTPGLQIHRSHWVADGAVVALRREAGKIQVVLACGNRLPIARSQIQAAQDRWGTLSA